MSDTAKKLCFREWMNLQEEALSELLQALNLDDADHHGGDPKTHDDDQLRQLIEKNIKQFEDYIRKRASLAKENVSIYFSPRWCTALECSMLWIAGCRPSIYIRLLYALIGEDFESRLEEFLQGKITGTLGDISLTQMNLINSLHVKTIQEEDKLSTMLVRLQEDMADQPICLIAKQARTIHGEPCEEIRRAVDVHAKSMASMMEEGDKLRLKTLKEVISILTPVQAANFLAASKKLHLCIHEWTRDKETSHGSTSATPSE